ncbi:nitrous oxide-stimulated promoter family protein [Thaumasiovibrio sp. DFM-14]|uniref:nitrous oxide-stimulated promoter family protein n=1 Tax=Thaumasiovibrio sp. DFM-14 TaxID=3384792 RepID=UPI0039A2D959
MKTIMHFINPQYQEPLVVKKMVQQYCQRIHRGAVLCDDCQVLIGYIGKKIGACRSGEKKSCCLQCKKTCLSDAQRLKLKHIMTWSVERVGWREPSMMLKYHWLTSRQRSGNRATVNSG